MRVPCCSSTRSHVRRERAAPSNRRAVGAAHGTRRGTWAAAKRTGQSGLAAAARSARGCEWGARREHAAARGSTAQQRAQQNLRCLCCISGGGSLCCISGGGRARRRRQRRWDGVRSWRTGALVVRRPVLIKRVHPAPKRAPGCAPMRGPPDALRTPRDLCLTPRKIQEPQVVLQLPGIHS